ncbi:hypothetical protein E2C01_052771 [Portunus trituberculatus]|uniref:Uncharacterized protein n=1 Tax=Portunus trituberculatus TaxID=210409 RepID=A0A5B7GIJ9_PORTR|nr:hypothetical protein [Portunus trituberculatus]
MSHRGEGTNQPTNSRLVSDAATSDALTFCVSCARLGFPRLCVSSFYYCAFFDYDNHTLDEPTGLRSPAPERGTVGIAALSRLQE